VIAAALGILIVSFYVAGVAAERLQVGFNWAALGTALALSSGFFCGIMPRRFAPSLLLLPVSQHVLVWDNVMTSLRYPVLISLVVIIPSYLGQASSGYYGVAEYVLLFVVVLSLMISVHIGAFATAQVVRRLTGHVITRLSALVAFVALAVYLLLRASVFTNALGEVLGSVTWSEASLVLIGSLGVVGSAMAMIELLPPRITATRFYGEWNLAARQRNFRVAFSLNEAHFIREMLFSLRNVKLHQRLALLLIFFLLLTWLGANLAPLLPQAGMLVLAATIGVVGFSVSFRGGQRLEIIRQRLFHLPTKTALNGWGAFMLPAIITTFFAVVMAHYFFSLYGSYDTVSLIVLTVTALAVHWLAFNIGRFVGQHNDDLSYADEGYGILIILLSVLLVTVSTGLLGRSYTPEVLVVAILWALFYGLGTSYLLRPRSGNETNLG
jgi:hypothetical protein